LTMMTNYFFNEIFNNISESISVLDEKEQTLFVNSAFLNFTGYSQKEIVENNKNLLSFTKQNYPNKYLKIKKILKEKKLWEGNLWCENVKSNKLLPVSCKYSLIENRGKTYILEIFIGIADIHQYKKHIKFLKYYNEFLSVPNKNFLQKKIKNETKSKEKFSLILIVLNNLKIINDTYGRHIGNRFLQNFSNNLELIIQKNNGLIFYLEGNQFIIFLHTIKKEKIISLMDNISSELISKSITIENNDIPIDAYCSCYIVNFPEDYLSILHKLYIAIEVAKKEKNKNLIFYESKYKDQIFTRFKIETLIKDAIKNHKFILYYQPRVNFANKIESVEALIRIVSDDGSLLSPKIFIPVAEESDLINKIGDWVFNQIIEDSRYITTKSGQNIRFSFNVSASQFLESDFLHKLKNIFKFSQDFPSLFEIEITEWALMKDTKNSIKKMFQLKELGFDLIIDDFGTGYSSLAYLKKFPINRLKIDKTFIDDLPADTDDIAITKAIISMGKSLGMRVVAEGVEEKEQLDFLMEQGCDEVQGYCFSKPLLADEFVTFYKYHDFGKLLTQENSYIEEERKVTI